MQPHLRKCFEAIHSITMKGKECEMTEMTSPEKEAVPFLTPLYPKGSVEVWMGEIETMMRKSVRHVTEVALKDYTTKKRGQFVLDHAAMVVLSVTQFYWTKDVEDALDSGGAAVRWPLSTPRPPACATQPHAHARAPCVATTDWRGPRTRLARDWH